MNQNMKGNYCINGISIKTTDYAIRKVFSIEIPISMVYVQPEG